MAWRDTLLDASFRGVVFHIKSIKGSAKRAIVEHSYPYRDGAELEDNGLNARRFQFTAVFWGHNYDASLQQFIAALDEGGEGEFIHPVYGSIPTMVESYEDPFDAEQPDYLELGVCLVESGRENPFFQRQFNAAAQAQNQGASALSAIGKASASLGQELAAFIDDAAKELDIAQQLQALDGMHAIINDYRAVKQSVLSGLNYLDFPTALVSDLQTVISEVAWLINLSPDGALNYFSGWQQLSGLFSRLPLNQGGAKSAYPSCASAYAGANLSASSASQQQVIISLPPASSPSKMLQLNSGLANKTLAAVNCYANLEQTRQVLEGATYILQQEAAAPSLTPPQVETIVGNARSRIQDSLAEIRLVFGNYAAHDISESLRDSAYAIQEQGRAIINQRPPLISHQASHHMNLHLLAHYLYGDYKRATEIRRINPALRCPNFVAQGMELKVYAK